jgi:acyl carrier protein
MDLLTDIEETLGVALSEADITPANLGTMGRLLQFLRGRVSQRGPGYEPRERELAQ